MPREVHQLRKQLHVVPFKRLLRLLQCETGGGVILGKYFLAALKENLMILRKEKSENDFKAHFEQNEFFRENIVFIWTFCILIHRSSLTY